MLSRDQARTNVVNEILQAEREYVGHLKDVIEVGTSDYFVFLRFICIYHLLNLADVFFNKSRLDQGSTKTSQVSIWLNKK